MEDEIAVIVLTPRIIHNQERAENILKVMLKCLLNKVYIPTEWQDELNDLIDENRHAHRAKKE
tara:strand:- start:139 stop:327 length:189 start_codon:yes stop_codon:yes gene_type:complete